MAAVAAAALALVSGPGTALALPQAPTHATGADELLKHIPASIRSTCAEEDVTRTAPKVAPGLVAGVLCHPGGSDTPKTVEYLLYKDTDLMNDAFAKTFPDVPQGDCTHGGPAQTTYTNNDTGGTGKVVCAENNGQKVVSWTDEKVNILATAIDERLTLAQLGTWWSTTDAGPSA